MKRRSRTHRVTATMTVERPTPGAQSDGIECEDFDEIELQLSGIAHSGCDETGPSYASGGEPAEPPSVEDIVAKTTDGQEFELTDEEMKEAEEALLMQDEPYDERI